MELLAFAAIYVLSWILSAQGLYLLSGAVLIIAAVLLTVYYYCKSGRRVSPPAVFSISWIGGAGVSCLKLSRLQTDWESLTWISIFCAYIAFIAGYSLSNYIAGRKDKNRKADDPARKKKAVQQRKKAVHSFSENKESAELNRVLYIMLNAIAAVSVISFLTEAYILGYIPLFTTDTPHAYSYFHVSGLHYFTVSFCLLPALGAVCLWNEYKSDDQGKALQLSTARRADITLCMSAGVLIPILLVSRYQLFFGILLAGFSLLVLNGSHLNVKLNLKTVSAVLAALVILTALYVFITIERAHSVEYLNSIFEMKYSRLPIFISQPYIYIANNFDNLNCLVKELENHTNGLRMLFPLIALTGLKFIKPELCSFPLYVTKEELTTVTLIYDSYYDFGIAGVIIFCLAVGFVIAYIEEKAEGSKGFAVLLYAEALIYLSLAFFTTWLSNPTTWFLFAVTAAGMAAEAWVKAKT